MKNRKIKNTILIFSSLLAVASIVGICILQIQDKLMKDALKKNFDHFIRNISNQNMSQNVEAYKDILNHHKWRSELRGNIIGESWGRKLIYRHRSGASRDYDQNDKLSISVIAKSRYSVDTLVVKSRFNQFISEENLKYDFTHFGPFMIVDNKELKTFGLFDKNQLILPAVVNIYDDHWCMINIFKRGAESLCEFWYLKLNSKFNVGDVLKCKFRFKSYFKGGLDEVSKIFGELDNQKIFTNVKVIRKNDGIAELLIGDYNYKLIINLRKKVGYISPLSSGRKWPSTSKYELTH